MTYPLLTIDDEPALLDAKARGAEWVARDKNAMLCGYATKPEKRDEAGEWYSDDGFALASYKWLRFVKWKNPEPVNIDLALAQIAEMERAEKPQEEMTIHGYSIRHLELIAILMRDHGVTPEDVKEAARNYSSGAIFAFNAATEQIQKGFKEAVERMHSPYTEGATK